MNKTHIATTSDRHRPDAKLLVIHAESNNEQVNYLRQDDFVSQFKAGDVLVANAAATLPASYMGIHRESGREIELRLAQNLSGDGDTYDHWKAFVFGQGDWRLPTENRTETPPFQRGDRLNFGAELEAEVLEVSAESQRFIEIRFLSAPHKLLHQMYQVGRLIQYSYHQDALELWDGQTIFASKPIALEAPSASFLLTWEIVLALQNKGVQVVSLLHAAGISSTGEENLDQLLPLPEYFEIPQAAVDIINTAKQENRGVIALGTSVTRALESAAMQDGEIRPGSGITTLLLSPTYNRKIVTGLITGMHEDGTSHLQLLQSFAPWKLIEKAYSQAKNLGYLWHEYGDACLILA